jgi:hypothetical protein
MEIASRISGLGNVITAGYNLYQTAENSKRAQAQEQTRHEQEMELMRQQHRQELITAKQTYLISTFTDIEQYCQELNENLVNSTKDSERDMVDQRNQQFQTILLAGTVMITSVLNILIQGPLPENVDSFSKISYSLANCTSIFFISLNMLLCIQLIYRITQFMYRRSEMNLTQLQDAMSETRTMMQKVRGDDRSLRAGLMLPGDDSMRIDESIEEEEEKEDPDESPRGADAGIALETSAKGGEKTAGQLGGAATASAAQGRNGVPMRRQPSNRSHISSLSSEQVDMQWQQHEAEVHTYLHRRSAINERREVLRFGAISFEHFWNTSCKDSGFLALISFYIGTAMMLLATMVYFWNQYVHVYNCKIGAVAAVVTIGVSLVTCLGFAIYLRFFDPSINNMRDDTTTLTAPDNAEKINKYE